MNAERSVRKLLPLSKRDGMAWKGWWWQKLEEMEHIYWQDDIYLARLVEESYVRGEKRGRVKNNLSVFLFCFVLFLPSLSLWMVVYPFQEDLNLAGSMVTTPYSSSPFSTSNHPIKHSGKAFFVALALRKLIHFREFEVWVPGPQIGITQCLPGH